jgi:hypothetical protein
MDVGKKAALLAGLLVLMVIWPHAWAVSASEAANYVAIQKNFLYPEEKYEQPNLRIEHIGKAYWVIPVTLNDELTVLFAVEEENGSLQQDKALNRHLFRTSALLRNYTAMKKRISERADVEWIVTKKYSATFRVLADLLQGEISDLGIIRTTVNSAEVTAKTDSMASQLASMSVLCNGMAQAVDDAIAFEGDFFSVADTAEYSTLKNRVIGVFSRIAELDSEARSYQSEVNGLQQIISVDGELSPQDKSFLIERAEPDPEFRKIGGYATTALQLQETTEAIYSNLQKNLESYLSEFEQRLKREEAYSLLYGENTELADKTGNTFADLKSARDYMLEEERAALWEDQESVSELSGYWQRAENYFVRRDYDNAMDYGNKALREALAVYNGGLRSTETEPLLDSELIFRIVILLVALLILIYAWNNRERIMGIVAGGKDKEKGLEI